MQNLKETSNVRKKKIQPI